MEMEGDGDGFRSERWRVREKMEGDRAQTRVIRFILYLRKTKEKIHEGILGQKIKDTGLKRGLKPSNKKRGYTCKKRGLRPGLRPRLKNTAGPFIFKPRFLKTGL